jgi:hypothetical protein
MMPIPVPVNGFPYVCFGLIVLAGVFGIVWLVIRQVNLTWFDPEWWSERRRR